MNWDLVGISVEQQCPAPNYSKENLSFSYGQTNRMDALHVLIHGLNHRHTHTHARTHTFPRKANDQYSSDEHFTIC